ncbi:hypothetical protein [Streptomyces sp. NPDC049879]|uniref:hypothetical protein n=1 Tax=Streptomyces sp. NPDC049879 TaxID=3365598 RepID=UPI0037B52C27
MTPRSPLSRTARRAVPRRSRREGARTLLCALALGAALAACGGEDPDAGTNGLGKLDAPEIEERARAAAAGAASVRLAGTVISGGHEYELDVQLARDGAAGEVASEGGHFQLLRAGEELYISADAAFWQSDAVPEGLESDPAQTLDGKYVLVAPEDPAYEQLVGFTEMDVLLDGLLVLEGEREKDDRAEVDGVETIRVTADGGAGGALDVALIGEPYPLRLERGGGAGELTLRDWDEPFEPVLPDEEQVVDYGEAILDEGDGEDGGDG